MNDPQQREALIERAKTMVPMLREHAAQAENDRAIPRATHQAFVDAGFYRIHQPKRFGGFEMDLSMMIDLAAELGRGCGSSCWIFTNLAIQNFILGMHYPETQEEVWGPQGDGLIASSFPAKGGKTRKVDGGIVVDGLWSFASGVDFADWNNLQVFVPQESGPPQHRFALVPKSAYTVVDDWFSAGLAGTGSRSIRFDNCFIPDRRTLPSTLIMGGATPGSAVNPSPLYRIPPMTIGTKVFGGPALGIARGALEDMTNEMRTRKNVAGLAMSEMPTVQVRIAEAGAEIEAAWALLIRDSLDAIAIAGSGGVPEIDQRARWRLNNAFAGQLCLRAVERLHPLAGARGLDADSPFQRAWRDIHAAVLQITMSWDIQSVNAGRIRFGLSSLDPRV